MHSLQIVTIRSGHLQAHRGFEKSLIAQVLPRFPGVAAWKQAVDAGVAETGCTVHFVDGGMDTGPVIVQESVPVHANDTPESLHARIQAVEHRLYPEAIRRLS